MRVYYCAYLKMHIDLDAISAVSDPSEYGDYYIVYLKLHEKNLVCTAKDVPSNDKDWFKQREVETEGIRQSHKLLMEAWMGETG